MKYYYEIILLKLLLLGTITSKLKTLLRRNRSKSAENPLPNFKHSSYEMTKSRSPSYDYGVPRTSYDYASVKHLPTDDDSFG